MSTTLRRVAGSALLSLLCALSAGAIEVGLELQSGNLHYPWDQTSPLAGTGAFPATNLFWGGSAWARLSLGEDYELKIAYERDPVLRNTVSGLFQFERGIARIGVGPFLGFLNEDGKLASAGLSTAIRLQWPGIGYVSARSDGGLSLGLVADAASIPQSQAELAAGFYAKNAIVSLVISGKRFSETDPAGKLVADNLTLYALTVDIYKKNVPYQILTTAGYQVRSKYFQATDSTDALGSILLGFRLSVQAAPGLKFLGELSTGAFTFGLENLKGRSPSAAAFMFDASFGCVIDLELLPKRQKASPEEEAVVETPTQAATPDSPTSPAPVESTVAP